jgi:CRP/FNR family transcriptional regulator, cyclic AMP receptor protein
MSRKTETLASIGLFRSLKPEDIRLLDSQCSWRRTPRNQWIIDFQDTSNDVFFIVSGTARAKLQAISGREVLLRELKAGEFFGEIAAIDGQPRSTGIIAVTDVTTGRMPASAFRAAIHAHSGACDQLLARLVADIRKLTTRVHEYTTLDARYRIYAELLRLARPAETLEQAVISPPPAHAEIAARVSIRREAVARELKALERAGLIEHRLGALVLRNPGQLRQLIERATEAD